MTEYPTAYECPHCSWLGWEKPRYCPRTGKKIKEGYYKK